MRVRVNGDFWVLDHVIGAKMLLQKLAGCLRRFLFHGYRKVVTEATIYKAL